MLPSHAHSSSFDSSRSYEWHSTEELASESTEELSPGKPLKKSLSMVLEHSVNDHSIKETVKNALDLGAPNGASELCLLIEHTKAYKELILLKTNHPSADEALIQGGGWLHLKKAKGVDYLTNEKFDGMTLLKYREKAVDAVANATKAALHSIDPSKIDIDSGYFGTAGADSDIDLVFSHQNLSHAEQNSAIIIFSLIWLHVFGQFPNTHMDVECYPSNAGESLNTAEQLKDTPALQKEFLGLEKSFALTQGYRALREIIPEISDEAAKASLTDQYIKTKFGDQKLFTNDLVALMESQIDDAITFEQTLMSEETEDPMENYCIQAKRILALGEMMDESQNSIVQAGSRFSSAPSSEDFKHIEKDIGRLQIQMALLAGIRCAILKGTYLTQEAYLQVCERLEGQKHKVVLHKLQKDITEPLIVVNTDPLIVVKNEPKLKVLSEEVFKLEHLTASSNQELLISAIENHGLLLSHSPLLGQLNISVDALIGLIHNINRNNRCVCKDQHDLEKNIHDLKGRASVLQKLTIADPDELEKQEELHEYGSRAEELTRALDFFIEAENKCIEENRELRKMTNNNCPISALDQELEAQVKRLTDLAEKLPKDEMIAWLISKHSIATANFEASVEVPLRKESRESMAQFLQEMKAIGRYVSAMHEGLGLRIKALTEAREALANIEAQTSPQGIPKFQKEEIYGAKYTLRVVFCVKLLKDITVPKLLEGVEEERAQIQQKIEIEKQQLLQKKIALALEDETGSDEISYDDEYLVAKHRLDSLESKLNSIKMKEQEIHQFSKSIDDQLSFAIDLERAKRHKKIPIYSAEILLKEAFPVLEKEKHQESLKFLMWVAEPMRLWDFKLPEGLNEESIKRTFTDTSVTPNIREEFIIHELTKLLGKGVTEKQVEVMSNIVQAMFGSHENDANVGKVVQLGMEKFQEHPTMQKNGGLLAFNRTLHQNLIITEGLAFKTKTLDTPAAVKLDEDVDYPLTYMLQKLDAKIAGNL